MIMIHNFSLNIFTPSLQLNLSPIHLWIIRILGWMSISTLKFLMSITLKISKFQIFRPRKTLPSVLQMNNNDNKAILSLF